MEQRFGWKNKNFDCVTYFLPRVTQCGKKSPNSSAHGKMLPNNWLIHYWSFGMSSTIQGENMASQGIYNNNSHQNADSWWIYLLNYHLKSHCIILQTTVHYLPSCPPIHSFSVSEGKGRPPPIYQQNTAYQIAVKISTSLALRLNWVEGIGFQKLVKK